MRMKSQSGPHAPLDGDVAALCEALTHEAGR